MLGLVPSFVDVEVRDQVVERPGDHGLVELGAEEAQVVAHHLGEEALGGQLLELGGSVPLAQLLLVGAEQERHVQELGRRDAQGLVDHDLLGRVADVVVAADDVGDLHGHVVDDHGEVVRHGAVGALHDEVADGVVLEADLAAQDVVEGGAAGRHAHAQRVRLSRRLAAPDLLRLQRPAPARVHPAAALLLRRGALGLELLRRAEARVEVAGPEQSLDVLVVDGVALRLPVRPVRARRAGTLVPVQAHLLHRVDDLHDRLIRAPADVGVLDAEDERALMLPGEDVVVEARAGAAQVQIAGGRGSEADAWRRGRRHRPADDTASGVGPTPATRFRSRQKWTTMARWTQT